MFLFEFVFSSVIVSVLTVDEREREKCNRRLGALIYFATHITTSQKLIRQRKKWVNSGKKGKIRRNRMYAWRPEPPLVHPLGRTRFHSHRVLFYISWFSFHPHFWLGVRKAKILWKIFIQFSISRIRCLVGTTKSLSVEKLNIQSFWLFVLIWKLGGRIKAMNPNKSVLPSNEKHSFHVQFSSLAPSPIRQKAMPFGLMLCSFWICTHFLFWHFYHYLYFVVAFLSSVVYCVRHLVVRGGTGREKVGDITWENDIQFWVRCRRNVFSFCLLATCCESFIHWALFVGDIRKVIGELSHVKRSF